MALRSRAILGTNLAFFTKQIAHRHPLGNRLELRNEFAKSLRKNLGPPGQIIIDPGSVDVMLEEIAPTLPELFIQQSIHVMVMDRLQGLQKLVGGVKKSSLVFRRQGLKIFQADSPKPAELRVFHEW